MIRFDSRRFARCGAILLCTIVLAVQAAPAGAADEGLNEAGVGAASAAATLFYGPVKIVYSAMGLIFGGFAYGLSGGDAEVMTAVITPAVRGDYVVTPAHIRGEKPLTFFGRRPGYGEQAAVVLEEIY